MYTTSFVRRHIFMLPRGQPFTTRDLLRYGSRSAVDQALFRLVKSEVIVRLARGVFVILDAMSRIPSVLDVAKVKAESFGKQIVCHGADAAQVLGLPVSANRLTTYSTNGCSSSFRCGEVVVCFKRVSQRNFLLGDSRAGLLVRALWHLGQAFCNKSLVSEAALSCTRTDREELRQMTGLMPGWISSSFSWTRRWQAGRQPTSGWH